MNALAFLVLFTSSEAAPKWYGPETVTFRTISAGNPYDFEKNDMVVRFVDGKGNQINRIAYYDEDEAGWKATLLADTPGKFRPILVRNGVEVDAKPEPEFVNLKPSKGKGFVRRDPALKHRFRFDDETPYMPLGFNLGWQSPDMPDLPDMIRKMGKHGVNWSRIWACNWDGKNPWWPNKDGVLEPNSERMWFGAFRRWDQIVKAAEDANVNFQFVMFNHGSFSTKVNPNWQDHPWNAKNGGFLKNAADFFTDPEAKKRAKMWLRYAVARYGHSPNVLAWELFNEVEWVDARYSDRWKDVVAWHKEMAEYVRSIDPYHHLITTSSTFELPNLYDAVDYYQPHTYPADIRTAISYQEQPADKPLFFGEFGPNQLEMKGQRWAVRDGIWAGLLSGQAGGGCFWTWEVVERENLYTEYEKASRILEASGLKSHPAARPIRVKLATAGLADLKFAPGAGWTSATKTTFEVNPGEIPEGLGSLPSFLQGPNHREMFPKPLVFKFEAPKAGKFTLALAQAAKAGARVKITLNGKEKIDQRFEPAEKDRPIREPLVIDYAAGHNEISIENTEGDWVTIRSFSLTGLGLQASAQAIGQVDWLMVRLTAAEGASPESVTLSSLGLAPGKYEVATYSLEDDSVQSKTVQFSGIEAKEIVAMPTKDQIVVFRSVK
ncbi:MAG: hypothetical protein BGO01_02060 [Armatimonadetes bacterium 55-13]|nr:hypothetical protein [Armatimonadota bacterium]OJU65717.1 MAG: hypothetical protein BGO01_02060 [Armatimonadetes bacterium 55-13]